MQSRLLVVQRVLGKSLFAARAQNWRSKETADFFCFKCYTNKCLDQYCWAIAKWWSRWLRTLRILGIIVYCTKFKSPTFRWHHTRHAQTYATLGPWHPTRPSKNVQCETGNTRAAATVFRHRDGAWINSTNPFVGGNCCLILKTYIAGFQQIRSTSICSFNH